MRPSRPDRSQQGIRGWTLPGDVREQRASGLSLTPVDPGRNRADHAATDMAVGEDIGAVSEAEPASWTIRRDTAPTARPKAPPICSGVGLRGRSTDRQEARGRRREHATGTDDHTEAQPDHRENMHRVRHRVGQPVCERGEVPCRAPRWLLPQRRSAQLHASRGPRRWPRWTGGWDRDLTSTMCPKWTIDN